MPLKQITFFYASLIDDKISSFFHYLQTVDTYYRKCSSAYYLHSVSIPLFCISSMDDPVCTKEAIPVDECRYVII